VPERRGASLLQRARGGDAVAERLGTRGVRGNRTQVQPAQLGIPATGQNERQGDGAVQQVGAARLPRPLGGTRDV
jgi:hypothetical protein